MKWVRYYKDDKMKNICIYNLGNDFNNTRNERKYNIEMGLELSQLIR